jgi:hypothetical protein
MENDAPIHFLRVPETAAEGPAAAMALAVLAGIARFLAAGFYVKSRRKAPVLRVVPVPKSGIDFRWSKDTRRMGVTSTRRTCTACGVEAYTQDGGSPKECKRALRSAAL